MFKHQPNKVPNDNEPAKPEPAKPEREELAADPTQPPAMAQKTSSEYVSPADLKALMEKNLKWSQIIYEQNRRINHKLFWSAFANWLKLILIIGSIVVGGWFLKPYLGDLMTQYKDILGTGAGVSSGASSDSLIKMFNLDPAQQEKLKALLK